jgi:chromosome partitioning protein
LRLAIANQKGGVGKTTLAFHLIHAWAEDGKEILAVDMDPQGDLTSSLIGREIPETALVSQIFEGKSPQPVQIAPHISLAAAEISLSVHEKDLSLKNYFRLKTWLDELQGLDVVIIDCPPSLGLFTINALVASKWVVAPVDVSFYAVRALGDLLGSLEELKEIGEGAELLGIAPSAFSSRQRATRAVQELLDEEYGDSLFSTILPSSTRVREALILGVPVWKVNRYEEAVEAAFRALADEIWERAKGGSDGQ